MSKTIIYTVNDSGDAATVGNPIKIGTIVRRYGKAVLVNDSMFILREAGYYKINVSANVNAGSTGNVKLTLRQDDEAVAGGTVTGTIGTATTQYIDLSINSVVRVYNNRSESIITLVPYTTAPTIQNLTITIEKV